MSLDAELQSSIDAMDAAGLLRVPPVLHEPRPPRARIDGREVLVFCSNDYLGLSGHPAIAAALSAAAAGSTVGAGASRLISGTQPTHLAIERGLAELVGRPSALLFTSGYAANVGTLAALIGPDDLILSDRLNHASLIDGMRQSRASVAVYPHRDLAAVEATLADRRAEHRRAWVVTDAVFSMDGDLAPLRELRALCDRFSAHLYIDEAHALGVVGEGRGLSHETGVVPEVLVGTLGKAFGLAGAFVAGSPTLRRYLENRARSYVFSTAPPVPHTAAIAAALELVANADDRRDQLRRHVETLRRGLRSAGHMVAEDRTPIVPLRTGTPAETVAVERALLERGFYVRAIRPPTVPTGESRLRIVPTAAHTESDVRALLAALVEIIPAP